MKPSALITSCKTILFINIVFWSVLATIYATTSNPYYYSFIAYLLFLEPVFFLGALIGVHLKRPIIYLLSLAFTFINAILSVTDEIGTLDLVSALLSALAFVNLLLIKKELLRSPIFKNPWV